MSSGAIQDQLARIRAGLRADGHHYEPSFPGAEDGRHVIELAQRLGPLYMPSGLPPDYPAVVTLPEEDAPLWRPFDQGEAIGWHNDFSTLRERPHLSFLWIAAADPGGPGWGDWRVASVEDVLARVRERETGQGLIRRARNEALPFGYEGSPVSFFRVVELTEGGKEALRFYRRALWEGAKIHWGEVPKWVRELAEGVAQAADSAGKVLPAREGALLVVDNRRSLHDRLPQTVRGENLRRSVLCFVEELA